MRNILLVAAVTALLVVSVTSLAQDDSKQYFTAGVWGDVEARCGVDVDGEVEAATGEDPGTGVVVDLEEEAQFCLGGQIFVDLDEGDYEISIDDDLALAGPSGAYRVHDADGAVLVDNVDECFDPPLTTADPVPQGGLIVVWVDGVFWWAQGQPCGVGQQSTGTFGSVDIRLL